MRLSLSCSPGKWARDVRSHPSEVRQAGSSLWTSSDGPGGGGLSPLPAGSIGTIACHPRAPTCPGRPWVRLVLLAHSSSRKIQTPRGTGLSGRRASAPAAASPVCPPRLPGAGRWTCHRLGREDDSGSQECPRGVPRRAPRGQSCQEPASCAPSPLLEAVLRQALSGMVVFQGEVFLTGLCSPRLLATSPPRPSTQGLLRPKMLLGTNLPLSRTQHPGGSWLRRSAHLWACLPDLGFLSLFLLFSLHPSYSPSCTGQNPTFIVWVGRTKKAHPPSPTCSCLHSPAWRTGRQCQCLLWSHCLRLVRVQGLRLHLREESPGGGLLRPKCFVLCRKLWHGQCW